MKTRVILAYKGSSKVYIPQYKRNWLIALLCGEKGWQFYLKDNIQDGDKTKIMFYELSAAINHCKTKGVRQTYEVVWTDEKDTNDIV